MSTMKAFMVTKPGVAEVVENPLPQLRDGYILVKVVSVALNPTDWKSIKRSPQGNMLVGCDYAGIVEKVGKNVQKKFNPGDRVFGTAHGCNPQQSEDGAFAEYIVAKGDVQWRIPDDVSFQEAATFGVGVVTCIQCLYQGLELKWPGDNITAQANKEAVLVYGGSTATGYVAIQFAKASGYKVITTCSPHNFDLVRKAGADAVFDYKDPASLEEVRKLTNGELRFAMECVAVEAAENFCAEALRPEGGNIASVNGLKAMKLLKEGGGIESRQVTDDQIHGTRTYAFAYTVSGEALFKFGVPIKARPEDKEYVMSMTQLIESLIAEGKLRAIPYQVRAGGLSGIVDGMLSMEKGEVTGTKLVYNIANDL